MLDLEIHKILKSTQGSFELKLQLQCRKNSFTVISGPSGSGKTTLLNMIAGLMKPDHGHIYFDSVPWYKGKQYISPQERPVGLVFQDYSLFPHLTVEEQIKLVKPKHVDASEITKLLEALEIEKLAAQKPGQLSGGQQQRAAIDRTLIQRPKVLLLDEPLAAVDRKLRLKLQEFIQKVHQEYELTTLMVTHDVAEAIRLADQIIELDKGQVLRSGTPSQVFGHQELSGKFQFKGIVLEIAEDEVLQIATVLVEKQLIKVVLSDTENDEIKVGDEVIVASKAFNPIVKKL